MSAKIRSAVASIPCGRNAPRSADAPIPPEEAIRCIEAITQSSINANVAHAHSRPMPAPVLAMLERHMVELEMARKSMLYDASREAMAIMKGCEAR